MDRHDANNLSQGNGCASRPVGPEAVRSVITGLVVLVGTAALWGWMRLPLPPVTRLSVACCLGLLLYFSGAMRRSKMDALASICMSLGMTAIYLAATAAISRLLLALPEQGGAATWVGAQLFLAAVLILLGIRAWQLGSALGCAVSLLLSVHLQATFLAMPVAGWIKWTWFMAAVLLIAIEAGHFTAPRRRAWIHWAALLAVYGHCFVFLRYAPPDSPWQWVLAAMLAALAYLLLTAHAIEIEARRLSLECGIRLLSNTVSFGIFAWVFAGSVWPGQEWIGIGLTTVLVFTVGILTAITGGGAPVVTFFLAKAAVTTMITLVLLAPSAARTPVIAGSAIVPLLLYRIHPAGVFHLLALLPIALALIAALLVQIPPGQIFLGPIVLQHGWASLWAAAAVLLLLARWHAASAHPREHSLRNADIEKGMSLAYAGAASLIILTHLILSRGDIESLPLVLTCQALVFTGLGMVLAAPAVIVAAVMPLMAVAAFIFVVPPLARVPLISPGAMSLPENALLFVTAVGLAAYTECWMREDRGKTRSVTSLTVTAIAYFPVVSLLISCIATFGLEELRYIPVALNSTALALYLLSIWMGLYVLRSGSALLMLTAAMAGVFIGIWRPGEAYGLQWQAPALLILVGEYMIAERLSCRFPRGEGVRGRLHSIGWIAVAALAGVAGLYDWNSGPVFVVGVLGLSGCFFVMGRITRERYYLYCAATLALMAAAGLILLGVGGRGVA